jgi:hypothetical protein
MRIRDGKVGSGMEKTLIRNTVLVKNISFIEILFIIFKVEFLAFLS